MDSLLHSPSRPTTPTTPSPSERRRFQSESPLAERSLTRRRALKISQKLPEEPSAPSSPESSQYLSPKEHLPPNTSPALIHPPITALGPLAHLSLVQSQRNTLRSELRQQSTANVLQKESITSLRKLALRLAARTSVKDAHLERDAQTIGRLRKSEYLRSREYASAVVQLDKSVALHENVMNELVDLAHGSNHEAPPSNALHQMRSCPTLPFAPNSPPLTPLCGQKTSPLDGMLMKGGSSTTSMLPSRQYDLSNPEKEFQAVILDCRSRYNELERDIHEARSREDFMRHSTLSLQDTVEYQNKKLNDLESQKDRLQQELDKVSSKLNFSQESEFKLKAAIKAKGLEMDSLRREIEESKAEIISLNHSKTLMRDKLQNTQTKLVDSTTASEEMSAVIVTKAEDITCLKKLNFEANAKNEELEEVRKSLEEKVGQCQSLIETLQSEKSKTNLDLQSTRSLFDASKRSHDEIKQTLEIKDSKIKTLESEICQMKKLEDVVLSHEEKIRVSLTQNKELEQSKAALDKLLLEAVGRRANLETELTCIRASHSDLQARVLDAENASKKVEQELLTLQQTKSNIESSLKNAEDQLQTKVLAIEQLRTEVRSLQDSSSELQEQLIMAQSELKMARDSENNLRVEGNELRSALVELNKKEEQLIKHLEAISSKMTRLESLHHTTVETHSKLELRFSAVQSELTAMKASENDIRKQLTEAQSLVSKHRESIRVATTKIQVLEEANDALGNRLRASEEAKSALEEEISSISSTLEDINGAKKALAEQLDVSESANSRLERDLATTQCELKEAFQSKEKFNKDLIISQSSHTDILKELSAMKLDLDQRLQSEKQLNEHIQALVVSKDQIEGDLRTTRADHDNQSESHQEVLQQLRDLTASKSAVDDDLAISRKKLHETEKSKEEIHTQFSNLSEAKRELESDVVHLRSKLSKIEDSEAELCLLLETAREEKTTMELNLKSQLRDSDEAVISYQQELNACQEKLTSAEALATDAQSQLDATLTSMKDMERGLLAQLQVSNEAIERLEHDLLATQSKLSSSETSETSLQSQLKAFQEDKVAVENKFKSQLCALEEVAERIRQELCRTETKLKSTEKLSQCLETELETVKSTTSATQQDLRNDITKLTSTKTDLEEKVESTKSQLNASQMSEKSLLAQIEELRLSSDEVQHKLQTNLEMLQKNNRNTEEELASERMRVETIEEANKSLHAQLDEVNAAKSQTERELHVLQHSAQDLEINLQQLQSKLTQAETMKDNLMTQLHDSEETKSKLEADLALTQQIVDTETSRAQNLEKLLEEARIKSDKSTADFKQKLAAHQESSAAKLAAAEVFQASLLQKSYNELEKSRADQEQLRVFGTEIFELRAASNGLRSQLETAETETRQLKDSLEKESREKEDQLEQRLAIEADAQQLREAYEDLQLKLMALEQETSNLHSERLALELRLREQEEISNIKSPPSTPTSQPRKRRNYPSRFFSSDFRNAHSSKHPTSETGHSRAVSAATASEEGRSTAGVDVWQSKVKGFFERPFSSGGRISVSREGDGKEKSDAGAPIFLKKRRNTLHKNPPTF